MTTTKRRGTVALAYVAVFVAATVGTVGVYKLWSCDLRAPMVYGGVDATEFAMLFKGLIDTGWYTHNPYVGAPGGLQTSDYPIPEAFHFGVLKLISLFVKDWPILLNFSMLVAYPAIALTTYYALRKLKIDGPIAFVGSLLYAFAPYHFIRLRQQGHIFLASYYAVPLVLVLAVRLAGGTPFVVVPKGRFRVALLLRDRESITALVIAVISGATGIMYYPFFSACILLAAGALGAVRTKQIATMVSSVLLAGVSTFVFIANVGRSLLYWHAHGSTLAHVRQNAEAEFYGLKIAQMLLPIDEHRIGFMAALTKKYEAPMFLIHENKSSALGVVASVGFLLLIAWLFRPRTSKDETFASTLQDISALNLVLVLLGTVGGFGALIATILTPTIRGYNRVSIYISFLALLAVALVVQHYIAPRIRTRRARIGYFTGLAAVAILGILDQNPAGDPGYATANAAFTRDRDFVTHIERTLPAYSLIFQLPYVAFPESAPQHDLPDYALFKGYLHSKTLRWSYGAMRGRRGDEWEREIASRSPRELVEALAVSGFAGIYVARLAYEDRGAALEAQLGALVGAPTVVHEDGSASFFDIQAFAASLKAALGADEWERRRDETLFPMYVGWLDGFTVAELGEGHQRRWADKRARMVIENPCNHERHVTLDTRFFVPRTTDSELVIESPFFVDHLHVGEQGTPFSRTFTVPPGEYMVNLTCDPRPPVVPDTPKLVFGMDDTRIDGRAVF